MRIGSQMAPHVRSHVIMLPQVDDKVKGKEQCCTLIDPLGTVLSKESNSPIGSYMAPKLVQRQFEQK